ncbi:MAG: hypothetical protein ACYCQJ_07490 [Nitrososphaerales archaeon]
MRQSTIFFVVAILVLIWFGDETFAIGQICVTSCINLAGLSVIEQAGAVAILPIIIVLLGISQRRNENQKPKTSIQPSPKSDDGSSKDEEPKNI